MAIHSSVLAWEIPWAEESSGLHPWDPKKSDTTERAHTHTVYVYHSQFDGDIIKYNSDCVNPLHEILPQP